MPDAGRPAGPFDSLRLPPELLDATILDEADLGLWGPDGSVADLPSGRTPEPRAAPGPTVRLGPFATANPRDHLVIWRALHGNKRPLIACYARALVAQPEAVRSRSVCRCSSTCKND